jgi:hypothetical protein
MPFDTLKAKQVINGLTAHRNHPGGAIMETAATLLTDAVADATQGMAAVRGAEAEALKATRLYEDCLLEVKSLRESDAQGKRAIAVLREIAELKKGASAKAQAFLVTEALMPPVKGEEKA